MLELQDLRDFSIHTWYNKFEHIALKTILLELPEELLAKLQSDESMNIDIEKVCNEDFLEATKNAINSLNNNAFVKNNWHAPMDAKMFSFGNQLKVTNLYDLSLYLFTSTIISDDFSFQNEIPFYIALKPWKSIHPASEFRCIVVNNILRGITPRDWPTYYSHFKDEGVQILECLSEFFKENIQEKFPRQHYIFDVIMSYPDKPCILDFGSLNNKTNLYAFSWKEILPLLNKEAPEEIPPIFRYLESDIGIMTKADAIYKIANSFI